MFSYIRKLIKPFNSSDLINKTYQDAEIICKKYGYSLTILREDGQSYIVSSNFVYKNISIELENGKIVKIYDEK